MEQLFIFLLKSGLCTVIFYAIYWLFLKNETFYRFNRHFLLCGIILSLILPLFQYNYQVTVAVQNSLNQPFQEPQAAPNTNAVSLWLYSALLAYASVAGFFVFRHLFGLIKIKRIINRYGYTVLKGYKVVSTPIFQSSFSVFNYIFYDLSAVNSEVEKNMILEHEQAHVAQYHWADLLVAQLLCSLQWFNPFAWMYMQAIKQNHEYLADAAVLEKGNSPAVYRAALINHSLKVPVFMFASSFAQDDKFKRVKMMMSPASKPLKKSGVLMVIPFLAFFVMAFAKPVYVFTGVPIKKDVEKINVLPVATDEKPMAKTAPVHKTTAKPVKFVPAVKPAQKITISSDTSKIELPKAFTKRNLAAIAGKMEPLYILDGVEVPSINIIKTEDIESVDVLKGTNATALYGDRGEFGVVIVTSKKEKNKK